MAYTAIGILPDGRDEEEAFESDVDLLTAHAAAKWASWDSVYLRVEVRDDATGSVVAAYILTTKERVEIMPLPENYCYDCGHSHSPGECYPDDNETDWQSDNTDYDPLADDGTGDCSDI